jgi:hypothetical protein
MSLNLLEKTELWVSDVTLDNANLTEMAGAVARTLGLRCEDIDILGIGKDIVDAPLLDMRLDVVEEVCV